MLKIPKNSEYVKIDLNYDTFLFGKKINSNSIKRNIPEN